MHAEVGKAEMTDYEQQEEHKREYANVRADPPRLMLDSKQGNQRAHKAYNTANATNRSIFLSLGYVKGPICQQQGQKHTDDGEKRIYFHGFTDFEWVMEEEPGLQSSG